MVRDPVAKVAEVEISINNSIVVFFVKCNTFFVVILLACCVACLRARCQEPRFESYGIAEGLPQSSIWSIAQDSSGFLWVGTSDGLCRFDGYEFNVYKRIPGNDSSISGNDKHHLFVDKKGNVWAAHNKGISCYHALKNTFTNYYPGNKPSASETYNKMLGQDSQGNIWAGIMEVGIVKINPATGIMTILPGMKPERWLTYNGYIDRYDRIWYTDGAGGLYCHNILTGDRKKYLDTSNIWMLYPLGDTAILINTNYQLWTYTIATGTYRRVDGTHGHPDMDRVINFTTGPDGTLWLCTAKGIDVYDTQQQKIVHRLKSFPGGGHNYSYVHTAFRDRSGNMWIGTNGAGLNKLANTKRFVHYVTHDPGGSIVKAIYASADKLYVGYFNNGIDVFPRRKPSASPASLLPGKSVYALYPLDSVRFLALAADPPDAYLVNTKTGASKSILNTIAKAVPGLITAYRSYPFITKTKDGATLFNIGDRLIKCTIGPGGALQFRELAHLPNESIDCGYEDSRGNLYVGTMRGFYINEPATGKWIAGTLPAPELVKAFCEDVSGNIWVGTTSGICIFDAHRRLLSVINETNGLKNAFIYSLLCDSTGRMWMSHNKGLSVYEPATKTFRHYSKDDGLQDDEFNTGAYYMSTDGAMFFGGVNGVTAFFPGAIASNPVAPMACITKIKLFDELLHADTAYWHVSAITLPYHQNILSFEFAALEYTNSHRNQYAYMMAGIDKKWIMAGDKRFARYANLPPGNYVFKVKASNNDGVWQATPTTIAVSITPPFWQRSWFRLLCLLVGAGSIAGIATLVQKQRFAKIMRATELQHKLQWERERISRDLHDNVGTQLSLISNNIEWLARPLKAMNDDDKAARLDAINQTSRDVIANLRETIWALNKEHISMEEFTDKLKVFVSKQLRLVTGVRLQYSERIDTAIVLGPMETLNLFRMCQETVANSLKYAGATILTIEVNTMTDNRYSIRIADNGAGFSLGSLETEQRYGLQNIEHRAAEISCAVQIISAPGSGTTIIITKNTTNEL